MESTKENEWERIFNQLAVFLKTWGIEGMSPPCDFMLVDEDWGEAQQKICILNSAVLTPYFVKQLQGFLGVVAPSWSIVVVMDVPDVPLPEDGMGLLVTASDVEYHWNLDELRRILGNPQFFIEGDELGDA